MFVKQASYSPDNFEEIAEGLLGKVDQVALYKALRILVVLDSAHNLVVNDHYHRTGPGNSYHRLSWHCWCDCTLSDSLVHPPKRIVGFVYKIC